MRLEIQTKAKFKRIASYLILHEVLIANSPARTYAIHTRHKKTLKAILV